MTYYIKNRSGVTLFRSESAANLKEALEDAITSAAYLGGADLRGAYLGGTDLRAAYLGGAYLGGADFGAQWIIQGQTRSDGYAFFLQRLTADTEPMIKAGCHYFTIAQAQTHWETTRKGQPLLAETRAIVRAMVDTMHIRGLK